MKNFISIFFVMAMANTLPSMAACAGGQCGLPQGQQSYYHDQSAQQQQNYSNQAYQSQYTQNMPHNYYQHGSGQPYDYNDQYNYPNDYDGNYRGSQRPYGYNRYRNNDREIPEFDMTWAHRDRYYDEEGHQTKRNR